MGGWPPGAFVKPILFELMGLKVHSYLVFMVLGYVVALGLLLGVTKWAPKEEGQGLSWPQVWDLFVVMVVSSVFGAKLGHVLFEAAGHDGVDNLFELLKADPWHWARLSEGGYVWYGGMIGALSVAVVVPISLPPCLSLGENSVPQSATDVTLIARIQTAFGSMRNGRKRESRLNCFTWSTFKPTRMATNTLGSATCIVHG